MTVYFIRQKGTDYVKIGKTFGNPARRLSALQTGSPIELEIIALARNDSEKHFHAKFKKAHIRGEWFKIDGIELAQTLQEDVEFLRPIWVDKIAADWIAILNGKPNPNPLNP